MSDITKELCGGNWTLDGQDEYAIQKQREADVARAVADMDRQQANRNIAYGFLEALKEAEVVVATNYGTNGIDVVLSGFNYTDVSNFIVRWYPSDDEVKASLKRNLAWYGHNIATELAKEMNIPLPEGKIWGMKHLRESVIFVPEKTPDDFGDTRLRHGPTDEEIETERNRREELRVEKEKIEAEVMPIFEAIQDGSFFERASVVEEATRNSTKYYLMFDNKLVPGNVMLKYKLAMIFPEDVALQLVNHLEFAIGTYMERNYKLQAKAWYPDETSTTLKYEVQTELKNVEGNFVVMFKLHMNRYTVIATPL